MCIYTCITCMCIYIYIYTYMVFSRISPQLMKKTQLDPEEAMDDYELGGSQKMRMVFIL